MLFLDRLGWPVERVEGRRFFNFMRILFRARGVYMGTIKEWNDERDKRIRSDNTVG